MTEAREVRRVRPRWRVSVFGWILLTAVVALAALAVFAGSVVSGGVAVLLLLFVLALAIGPSTAIDKYGGSSQGRMHIDPSLGRRDDPPRSG